MAPDEIKDSKNTQTNRVIQIFKTLKIFKQKIQEMESCEFSLSPLQNLANLSFVN